MPKTILLVDDDAQILDTAKDILEAAGYDILTADTGAKGLEMLRAGGCGLAIIDFNLADMTGLALALKMKDAHPALVIVLMTGEAHVDLGAARTAIYATLTKPVNPSDLMALIQKAI